MIIKLLCDLVLWLLDLVFSWVQLPPMPSPIDESIGMLLQYLYAGLGFVYLVIPRPLVLACLPVILVVENFDRVYSMVMWILKKIPFLGMK